MFYVVDFIKKIQNLKWFSFNKKQKNNQRSYRCSYVGNVCDFSKLKNLAKKKY